ncbi:MULTISPECIES: hypothetical protein [unclassified Streptomyces]|uniref:hypothetical protein n=1 Tax=unclassified Streptomyces TaxID=2593676 RepID=UPI0020301507|nr:MULTISPECIES: hypothetical protein [unclassified Streptomyces]MCM1967260.1 hypothetical protein [Streptomyces sp. G1]MCX5127873.1 hypothetical protein [Streptomyces sp. NBC_00347]MCX5301461.1 hypothetical protein [Streptomyces sp. NBC_00193]
MTRHAVPPVWFRLPPGFHDIGPEDRGALEEVAGVLEALADFGDGTDAAAAAGAAAGTGAGAQLALLMDRLDELAGQPGLHLVHTAVGLHPEGPEAVSTSLFSLSVRPAEEPGSATGAAAGVARTALALARSAPGGGSTRSFVELASGLPCALVCGVVPASGTDRGLFQARAVTAHPEGRHLFLLDLTSAATEHAGAYTAILEAVAHTLSFADPRARTPGPPGGAGTSRILELLG